MGFHQSLFRFSVFVFCFFKSTGFSLQQAEEINISKTCFLSANAMDIQDTPFLIEEEISSDKEEPLEITSLNIETKSSLAGFIEKETAPLLQQPLVEETSEMVNSSPSKENVPQLVSVLSTSLLNVNAPASLNEQTNTITPMDVALNASSESFPSSKEDNRESTLTDKKAPDKEMELYEALPISDTEKEIIGKILTTMAENNLLNLWFQRKDLETLGQQIRSVHPIRFLGTVFSNPKLVRAMHDIRQSKFKWEGFIEGFTERLKEEVNLNNVYPYLSGFAIHVNMHPQQIKKYFDERNYEGLVLFLMHAKYSSR